MRMMQNIKVQSGWYPIADAYEVDTNKINSDVYNMSHYNHGMFIIHEGVGTTGTATITVLSCEDNTGSSGNSTAIVFDYSVSTTADTFSDLATATTAGFGTTAGSNHIYLIEIDATQFVSRSGVKDKYVQLVATELVDAAVIVSCLFLQAEPRVMADASDMPGALV